MKTLRAAIVAACLALMMVATFAGVASAHPAHQDRALSCTMSQIGSMSGVNSSPDGGIYGQDWLQEGFSGGVSCLTFQPASRIQTASFFDNPEPVYHWRIALYTSNNTYLTDYTWDSGSQSNPGFTPANQGWWYFYGPIITLSCATGQIHATMDVYESTFAATGLYEGDGAAYEGATIHHNSANMYTC